MSFSLCKRAAAGLVVLIALCAAAKAPQQASLHPHERTGPIPAPEPGAARNHAAMGVMFLYECLTLTEKGHYSEGEAACSRAILADPSNLEAYKLRGYAFLFDRRFEQANSDFSYVLASTPKDAESLAGYGESFGGLGRFDEAVAVFREVVALAPENAAYWSASCWAKAGTGLDLQSALSDCTRALVLAPAAPGALTNRGLVYLRLRQYETAVADYTSALSFQPDLPAAHFGRGLALAGLGQSGDADIAAARAMDPESDDLFVLLGVLPAQCAHASGAPGCPAAPRIPPEREPPSPYLAASFVNNEPRDEEFFRRMDATRLDLMVDQIAFLLKRPMEFDAFSLPQNRKAPLSRRLEDLAGRFNRLLPYACASGHVPVSACVEWKPRPSAKVVPDIALDDAYKHVRPVWVALCVGHEDVCQIE